VQDNNLHILTSYKEGYQYKQNKLQFFPTAEGYVRTVYCNNCVRQISYQYVYNYTDHLGNIRLSYTQTETGLKVLEENHYYPFGLKHDSYNQSKKKLTAKMENSVKKIKAVTRAASGSYKYKYNGKELQDAFGLNWYDYGARNSDPAVIPFTTIDPKAEEYYSQSPYVFASNNPVFYVDVNGEGVEDVIIIGKYSKEAFNQLQASVKGKLTLSMNDKGKVTAIINKGVTLKEGGAAQTLLNATEATGIIVNINTTDGFLTSDGAEFVGGAFRGSSTNKNGVVIANQTVNPKVQGKLDKAFERGNGTGILHEVLEGYVGAVDTPNSPAGTNDNPVGKANYDNAHSKAKAIDPRYNKTGKIGPRITQISNNGRGGINRTRFYYATKKNGERVPLGHRKLKTIKRKRK